MNGKCPTPRAQKSGKSPTLSRGGETLGDSLDTSIIDHLKVPLIDGDVNEILSNFKISIVLHIV